MSIEYPLNLPLIKGNGSFVDKSLKLQILPNKETFSLSNTYFDAMGLCLLSNLLAATSSTPTLVIAISSKPVVFYKDAPYVLEGNYLCGILSGEILSSIERRLATTIEPTYSPVIPLTDAFPYCVRLAFPTGSDEDADPPMEFLDQLATCISQSRNKKIFFIGDAESPGPLSVVLAAASVLFRLPLNNFSNSNHKINENIQIEAIGQALLEMPSMTAINDLTHNSEIVEFERISILVGSIQNGMKAKELVDEIFSSIVLSDGGRKSIIRPPMHRIYHHHAMGNLDMGATWLGRYATLILFAHWNSVDGCGSFLKWASLNVPDLVFGQLQAFSRRPASWWLFRPLHSSTDPESEAMETLHAMKRIRSGLPLILHSSALILKQDNPKEEKVDLGKWKKNVSTFPNPFVIMIGQIAEKEQSQLALNISGLFDRVLWLNLRGEPYVHIGSSTTWSLRDEATAGRHLRAFVGVPNHRLAEIENQVAIDITRLLLAVMERKVDTDPDLENGFEPSLQRKPGLKNENFYFFDEERPGVHRGPLKTTNEWPEGSVKTPAAVANIALGAVFGAQKMEWVRVPLPGDSQPSVENVAEIISAVSSFFLLNLSDKERLAIVIQCRTGREGSRAIFGAALVDLITGNFSQGKLSVKEGFCRNQDQSLESGLHGDPQLLALIRAAPHGRSAWQNVTKVLGNRLAHFQYADGSISRRYLVVRSRLWFLFVVASFLLDYEDKCMRSMDMTDKVYLRDNGDSWSDEETTLIKAQLPLGTLFKRWMNRHQELGRMLLVESSVSLGTTVLGKVCWNSGSSEPMITGDGVARVDSGFHILKDDHFIGCHRLVDSPISIAGAPNFRLKSWRGWILAGTGIPTLCGRTGIARAIMDAAKGQLVKLLWVNLREEPLLYLGNGPFVLREARRPFENLLMTGIHMSDVERIEEELCSRLLLQMDPVHPVVLVHGESEIDDVGSCGIEEDLIIDSPETVVVPKLLSGTGLTSYRLSLPPNGVQSARNALSTPIPGIEQFSYYRMPVSDERTPLPSIFDELKDVICKFYYSQGVPSNEVGIVKVALFHCQMGRGRTTTGLVLCALMLEYLNEKTSSGPDTADCSQKISLDNTIGTGPSEYDLFGVIWTLMDLLEHGPIAKQRVDTIIDTFSDVQNLRLAILALSGNPELRFHYLERYFYLICFGHFLFFEANDNDDNGGSFAIWLNQRPHIVTLARRIHRL